jgi:uncharacterized repeat protein (TIGR01451 family)
MFGKLIAIIAVGALGLFSASAFAVTPGNTSLVIQTKLTYAGNSTGITATSTVTVNVVASAPTLSEPGNVQRAENQSLSVEYTVTATNNGPDTYNLTVPGAISANTNAENIGTYNYDDGTTTSIALGATALSAVSVGTGNTISVPSDGGSADSSVNGLVAGEKVVINNVEYTIDTVTDPGGTGTATIQLTTTIADALPVGTGVFERRTFNLTVTDVGDRVTIGNPANYNVTTTLTSVLQGTVTVDDEINVSIVRITITKYVRNVTDENCTAGGGTGCNAAISFTINYHLTEGGSSVSAGPGETLEYLIRVVTPSEAGVANAVISDVLANFTTYVAGTTKMENVAINDGAGTTPSPTFPLDPSDSTHGGLRIQTGPTSGGAEGDGNVAANQTVDIIYQVILSAL